MLQHTPGPDQSQLTSSLRFKNGATCTVKYSPGEDCDGKGNGVLQWRSGMSYHGEFLGLQRHGKGLQRWPDGSYYEGEFKKDLRDGNGRFVWSSGHVNCEVLVLVSPKLMQFFSLFASCRNTSEATAMTDVTDRGSTGGHPGHLSLGCSTVTLEKGLVHT